MCSWSGNRAAHWLRCWPVLLLILATAVSNADEGFFFPDMEAVILHGEKGGFIYGPPQGYRAEELPPNHHFAILFRLINKHGPRTESLGVDKGDADYRLTVLARGESFPLLAGECWISDGENTVFMEKADYSTMQNVLNSRMEQGEPVPSERVEGYINRYKEYWTDPFPHEPPSERPSSEDAVLSSGRSSPEEGVSGEMEPLQKITEDVSEQSGQGSSKSVTPKDAAQAPAPGEGRAPTSRSFPEGDQLARVGSPVLDQFVEPQQRDSGSPLPWEWGLPIFAIITVSVALWRSGRARR